MSRTVTLPQPATTRSASPLVDWNAEIGGIPVRFGPGVLESLGEVVRVLGGTRALVVTDPGVRAAGYADHAVALLEREGVAAWIFDEVEENPTTDNVEAGRKAGQELGVDFLVGLGGGSPMDCAKGINFLLTNGGRMEDYQGAGKAAKPLLPSVGVPTTAGTGSEAQSYALISQAGTHQKMACGDKKARFRTVLLDPELVATAPRRVVATAGIDAISHAIESAVTRKGNPVSRMLAREAWRRLDASFERYLAKPGDLAAAADMLLGSHFAGAAIEASMLGAAHACANPLTAHYGIVHGAAVGLMLPAVIRFNAAHAPWVEDLYRELDARGAEGLAARFEALRKAAGLPERLRDGGVEEGKLSDLAEEAGKQWTGTFNPRPARAAEMLALYREAF